MKLQFSRFSSLRSMKVGEVRYGSIFDVYTSKKYFYIPWSIETRRKPHYFEEIHEPYFLIKRVGRGLTERDFLFDFFVDPNIDTYFFQFTKESVIGGILVMKSSFLRISAPPIAFIDESRDDEEEDALASLQKEDWGEYLEEPQDLQEELQRAIDEERFEDAARIKEKIEQQNKKGAS